jgi:hypothetical protein
MTARLLAEGECKAEGEGRTKLEIPKLEGELYIFPVR